jgi:protein subunit release factor A
MFNESSGDDREQWREEVNNAEEKIPDLEVNLETLLLPHDPNEGAT